MSEHEQNELWEKSLRGRLTPNEKARLETWLAARPDVRADWELEMSLCSAMQQLPDVPVSSNFTSLVMQAVAREERQAERAEAAAPNGFVYWLRKHFAQLAASTAVVAIAGFLAVQQHGGNDGAQSTTVANVDSKQEMAKQIKELAVVAPVPSVDALKDFETIRRMSQVSAEPDLELLAALQ